MFYLIANNLALDLMNTRIVDNGEPVDLITGHKDILDWAAAAGLIDAAKAAAAAKKWEGTGDAQKLVQEIHELRKLIRSIVGDLAERGRVSRTQLKALNGSLQRNRGFFAVEKTEDGYKKQFRSEIDNIESLLAPVAESAADLLCFVDPSNIRKCESPECVLYFYDTSKNHRRRWCSMAGCGNRAKAAAFYKRKKAAV